MAILVVPWASSAGGLVTVDLRVDDRKLIVTGIVAANNAREPVTFTVTANTGETVARTWQPGQTETVNVPGVYRVTLDALGELLPSFATTFSGPAMGV